MLMLGSELFQPVIGWSIINFLVSHFDSIVDVASVVISLIVVIYIQKQFKLQKKDFEQNNYKANYNLLIEFEKRIVELDDKIKNTRNIYDIKKKHEKINKLLAEYGEKHSEKEIKNIIIPKELVSTLIEAKKFLSIYIEKNNVNNETLQNYFHFLNRQLNKIELIEKEPPSLGRFMRKFNGKFEIRSIELDNEIRKRKKCKEQRVFLQNKLELLKKEIFDDI
jgi:hypothetical protein